MRRLSISLAALTSVVALLAVASLGIAAESSPRRQFKATSPDEALSWQQDSRRLLFDLLKLSDLIAAREKSVESLEFDVKEISSEEHDDYTLREIEFNATPTRRIKALLTIPKNGEGPFPAVVCIHGHGGDRRTVYDGASAVYRGFADKLASSGYVTISTDVGQHDAYEASRTLMGERLWDVLRCADYLTTLDEVDDQRMGCAGLSLGGEMSMWLGAMDPRMKAVVSSGFLTSVANLKDRHCQCWDFPGFTDNFGFRDIYSLTAPRALQCQIGELERAPGGFPADIAKAEIVAIRKAYEVAGAKDLATLEIHPEGHVYNIVAGQKFLDKYLKQAAKNQGN